jgi:hypothetical protein
MTMSRRGIAAILSIVAMVLPSATAAQVVQPSPEPSVTAEQLMAQTRRFTRTETMDDCFAERTSTSDIVVCGARQDQGLPLDPRDQDVQSDLESDRLARRACGGMACAGNVFAVVTITSGIVGLLLDPEANLGEGERIPQRFRGANR